MALTCGISGVVKGLLRDDSSQGVPRYAPTVFLENNDGPPTWRIIPISKWLATPIHKPFSPFGRGITLHRELTNHGY